MKVYKEATLAHIEKHCGFNFSTKPDYDADFAALRALPTGTVNFKKFLKEYGKVKRWFGEMV
jgi:hypothetical protein